MPMFRKKPTVIEARQCVTFHDAIDIGNWMRENGAEMRIASEGIRLSPVIVTLEGEMKISPDDWVIKGVSNEFYPCKPDIFEATYEPA